MDQLERLGLVRKANGNFKIKTTRVFRYYYQNLSMIPDVKSYTVFDFIRKKRIGTLDQEFVAKRCKSGTNIILHGNTWKVITTDEGNFSG